MTDGEKIAAVYSYLKEEFGQCRITDSYESGREAQVFRIESDRMGSTALVTSKFLSTYEAGIIPETLRKFLLAEHLRECNFPIVVTESGLSM
ncbi:MAG: hypothetical protein LLG06_12405 [Desulfobacteraceae bacterium]|nr:hypothetical protein [Desulfobacteraceae bacterium]